MRVPLSTLDSIRDTLAMRTDLGHELDHHLPTLRAAPRDTGRLEVIVRRPAEDEREVLDVAVLDPDRGLVGDDWIRRGSSSTPDGSPNPLSQLTLMSTRVLAAIEPDRSRWPLAGDQLLVDLDLSVDNLPPGTRLAIGDAELKVSDKPHTGCAKFSARFGSDALRWINGPTGRELRMRGVNCRILRGGTIRTGDAVRKR
jgi:MOSC domain